MRKRFPDIPRCQALDLFATLLLTTPTPCGEPAAVRSDCDTVDGQAVDVPLCSGCFDTMHLKQAVMPEFVAPRRLVGADRRG